MIAKIIPIKAMRKSSFSALVRYLTDDQKSQERVSQIMVTNCYTEDMAAALIEIQNTQDMNKRARSDKTCHLVLSFPEGERLPHADLNKIEERFCDVLCFADHQRISVVHDDTNNLHIHIAINKIHPRNYTIHNPFFDYKKVAKLCEQIEQEYALTKVNHETVSDKSSRIMQDIETKAGIESLVSWIKRECLDEIKQTGNWRDLHAVLRRNGLAIKERGNGFVFVSSNGIAVKASSVDRSLSKTSLTKRLGRFVHAERSAKSPQTNAKQYQPKPLQSQIDTTKLYAKYQQEQHEAAKQRTEQWVMLRHNRDQLIERTKKEAKLKRLVIKSIQTGRLAKKMMFATAHQQFKATIAIIKNEYREDYQAAKAKHPRMAWLDWLAKEARHGNIEALAVLRSRRSFEHQSNSVSGKQKDHGHIKDSSIDAITKKGTVFYKAGSATVRDDGKQLIVLPDTSHEALADILQMAMKKYGNHLAVNGTEQFRTEIALVAVQNNMRITFDDKALEQYRQRLMKQHVVSKTQFLGKKRSITSTNGRSL
jgi:TraI-like middle domain/MobA/VirD2-like, nuclease domain/Large polyvalent protein-associated domain 7